jgi:sugar transferase EpsL
LYHRFFKPLIDRLCAVCALVALAPVIAVLALLIRSRLGSPILFRQTRIGLQERPFEFLKFRTMTAARDEQGLLLPDEKRITPFGAFLRSSSLDELPQLWNVLRGEMSLIGPRPLLPQYLPRYSPFQRRRHEVKPGITGLAQVNGRNSLSWEDKFRFDVQYVDRCSAALDFRILIETLASVVRRKDINQAGQATAAEFLGSPVSTSSDRGCAQ